MSVRTLDAASLRGHREQRIASAGKSGSDVIWMLCKGERERTGTGLIPVTLPLAWEEGNANQQRQKQLCTGKVAAANT